MPLPNEQFTDRRLDPSSPLRVRVLRAVIAAAGVILLLLLIFFVLMRPFTVSERTVAELEEGELVFADRIGRMFADYDRGDILVYEAYEDGGAVKCAGRIAALPGERVSVTGGRIYIDGILLDESGYASFFPSETECEILLGEKELLLLPDSREEIYSIADFVCGYSDIIGEVRLRVYPVNRIEVFK